MNLLRPWRWFRAAVIELTGIAACLLLINVSHTERMTQLNGPPPANYDRPPQPRHTSHNTQSTHEELWQIFGVVLEKAWNEAGGTSWLAERRAT